MCSGTRRVSRPAPPPDPPPRSAASPSTAATSAASPLLVDGPRPRGVLAADAAIPAVEPQRRTRAVQHDRRYPPATLAVVLARVQRPLGNICICIGMRPCGVVYWGLCWPSRNRLRSAAGARRATVVLPHAGTAARLRRRHRSRHGRAPASIRLKENRLYGSCGLNGDRAIKPWWSWAVAPTRATGKPDEPEAVEPAGKQSQVRGGSRHGLIREEQGRALRYRYGDGARCCFESSLSSRQSAGACPQCASRSCSG